MRAPSPGLTRRSPGPTRLWRPAPTWRLSRRRKRIDEVAAVPRRVNGPCLLNVVYGGKTPDLDLREAEAMGYKLAIVPGLLMKCVVGICDEALAELKASHRHPHPPKSMTVREVFQRVGADEWDARRTQFRPAAPDPRRSGIVVAAATGCDRAFRSSARSPRSLRALSRCAGPWRVLASAGGWGEQRSAPRWRIASSIATG